MRSPKQRAIKLKTGPNEDKSRSSKRHVPADTTAAARCGHEHLAALSHEELDRRLELLLAGPLQAH
jgi:hypothetical protein